MGEARKTGIQPRTYVLIAGGSVVAYLIFRWYQGRQASNAQTATSGGTTIPAPTAGSASLAPSINSLAQWIQTALSTGALTNKYTSTNLYNDIQSWLNGNCVSATGYSVIGNLISTLGLPPGYASAPGLNVCPSTPAPKPPPTKAKAPFHWGWGPSKIPSSFTAIVGSGVLDNLLQRGYNILHTSQGIFYFTGQKPGHGQGLNLFFLPPGLVREYEAAGYSIYTYAGEAFYNPAQNTKMTGIKK